MKEKQKEPITETIIKINIAMDEIDLAIRETAVTLMEAYDPLIKELSERVRRDSLLIAKNPDNWTQTKILLRKANEGREKAIGIINRAYKRV